MQGYDSFIFIFGFFLLLWLAICWFNDIINEATFLGYHTLVVRKGLKLGFLLFIASEIMLFFGFFWAFFHSSLCSANDLGSIWPPIGINSIPAYDYPLFNTALLIISGFSVTWVHRGIALGLYRECIDGFFITIILGLFFIILQGMEYYESSFNLNDSVFACTFYMLTGLHGCHVIIGVLFLSVCFIRLLLNHFLCNHYLGLIFAIWYWHFVDGVWILLFLSLYVWGGW
jgi:cytochrome c oxidase subunit 3